MSDTSDPSSRLSGARGSATSISVALLTPIFVIVAFAAVQAALWSHARTEARVVARDTAALVARSGVTAADARSAAAGVLDRDTDLRAVTVSVTRDGDIVKVTVTGQAPGILRGTTTRIRVTEAIPIEELVPG